MTKFGAPEVIEGYARLMEQASSLIDAIPSSSGKVRFDRLRVLVHGTATHARACTTLARTDLGNEIFVVYRSLLERLVTFYYLQACDQSEYDRYIAYSVHKVFRKTERSLHIGGKGFTVKYMGEMDLDSNPELAEAVRLFTSPRGRTLTRWSNTSIEKKLETIESAGVVDTTALIMAIGTLYDDCSESAHATLYGCTFHLGLFQPDTQLQHPDDLLRAYRSNLTMTFFFGALLLSQLARYCADQCVATDLSEKATNLGKQAEKLMRDVLEEVNSPTSTAAIDSDAMDK